VGNGEQRIAERALMPQPKPFQEAAVAAACASFRSAGGSKRFLVADEVGLGKTVVAQQVIQQLAGTSRRSPFVVYYITNGQRVAHQNRGRLVDFLDPEIQDDAISDADRLNVIPLYKSPETPVALYALTPGTSFPGKKRRLHAGRKEERAFLTALLSRAHPYLVWKLPGRTMQGNVKSDWEGLVQRQRGAAARLEDKFISSFRKALDIEFELPFDTNIQKILEKNTRGRFVGRLRRALAHTVLLDSPPDLVILDEFQRYPDMLAKEDRKDSLIQALFEPKGPRQPALLLLSATPYKLYATRLEENRGAEANREFFDLLEFLGGNHGDALQSQAQEAFAKFGTTILAIAKNHAGEEDTARLVGEAASLRDDIQLMLAPYISRMEREPTSDDSAHTERLDAPLDDTDIRAFRHLASSFKPEHAWFALPFWLSVPLPAQSLGQRYLAWREATIKRDASLIKLTVDRRNSYALPRNWPSPKLRALEAVTPVEALALPWVPPSIPWWSLRGGWAELQHQPKLLLFSRFKSTPQGVAALTSLRVEARYLARGGGYEKVWKTRRLQAAPSRLATVALFHPSPFLILAADPLASSGPMPAPPRETVRKQLTRALKAMKIAVIKGRDKKGARRKSHWALLSALEQLAEYSGLTKSAWKSAAADDHRLQKLVAEWHRGRSVDWISGREFEELVTAALSSPGVILGRALLRHHPAALSSDHFVELVRLAWHGLRSYLDNPVFWARLPAGKPVKVVQRACLDGNLEAVLDEHFWMRRQSLPTRAKGLAWDLHEALSVSTGAFSLHSVNKERKPRIRVRCHVAVPFGSTDDDDRKRSDATGDQAPRSDELRNAFNSPFWPHVLATTSVGQEGLDFHTWCRRILHWDLCSSPLELEQREGRIQRFGGLAVRIKLRELAKGDLWQPGTICTHASLWERVEALANAKYRDPSGLSPWWVLKGATVSRFVFNLPQSRDIEKFTLLKEQRLIYRLALGQPNQEDLVDFLAKGGPGLTRILQPLALNLSAFARTLPKPAILTE
jgi:hypothetical protein